MSERRRVAADAHRALREGAEGIRRRQRRRLSELVAFARAESPYYRELYRGLPDDVDAAALPVTDKPTLMARFDDWVTDRAVTGANVEEFASDPSRVGRYFQGRYLVATTTGTSGLRGLFVLDDHNQTVHTALGSRTGGGLTAADGIRVLAKGARTAVVTAPGGHFATVAGAERFRLDHPRLARIMKVFSIKQPLPELVAALNDYNPASVAGFLGMLTVLAGEREAGRLRINPVMLIPGGETLTDAHRQRLATAFGAKIRAAYGCGECAFLSNGCPEGWYHVNADWAVAEPVDADYRPVPPGELSHTVLLSNLANRVQPFLRYDLGDNVMLRPDPCPCGNPLPAIQVRGRVAEMLTVPNGCGEPVRVSPMGWFGTVLNRAPGVEQFQVVQTAPATLAVRLRPRPGADPDAAWEAVRDALARLLADQKVDGVTIERARQPPEQSAGGKFRRVIPLA